MGAWGRSRFGLLAGTLRSLRPFIASTWRRFRDLWLGGSAIGSGRLTLRRRSFLPLFGASHRYRPERGSPKAWLYGIAQNVVAIDRRRAGSEQTREERLRGSALLDEGDAAEIDARIDAAASQRHVYEAMERLSEPERAVLEHVAIDELSLAEAAAAAGVRPVTARVRLHRARRKLRVELEAASTESNVNEGEPS